MRNCRRKGVLAVYMRNAFNSFNDALENKPTFVLSSCGVVTDVTNQNELIVENSITARRLTLSESVMWYGLMFDALTIHDCIGRYHRSVKKLNIKPDPPFQVIQSLLSDELVCRGVEKRYNDALFSMFYAGFLSCAVEQSDCGEYFRKNGHWTMYYDRYLHWDAVELSPVREEPLSDVEHRVMGMLISESWSIAELVRNFAKGYDATMTRFNLPEEHFRILSLDPDDDLVRLNYERHPLVRMVTDAVLNLLRSRKLLLY